MLTLPSRNASRAARSRGVTMIEVLVALLILTIGLLGVAGLQARMQTAEIEAFQRAQAIVLLQDMVDRINANRVNAASYATGSVTLGTGTTLDCSPTALASATVMLKDKCEWSSAMVGAAETRVISGTTTNIGAMNEARGCITVPVTTMPREVVVAVVWQGIASTVVPTATTCGVGEAAYGSDGKLRRALIARVKIACLHNDPVTGACVTL
jgi:type IV pilus assembly protein PilV